MVCLVSDGGRAAESSVRCAEASQGAAGSLNLVSRVRAAWKR